MIAICKIWSFSFSKLEWHNLHFLNLEGRGIVGETNQISDTWEYSIKFRLLSSTKCGGTALQSPARAEQIHRNLLYDVGVLLFPWFEPWLDNRLKTFVMCSPTDYWEKRWQKKTQPAQSAIHSGLSGRRCCCHDKEKRNARVSRHITQSIESTQSAAQ